jgi:hypothetical protein
MYMFKSFGKSAAAKLNLDPAGVNPNYTMEAATTKDYEFTKFRDYARKERTTITELALAIIGRAYG